MAMYDTAARHRSVAVRREKQAQALWEAHQAVIHWRGRAEAAEERLELLGAELRRVVEPGHAAARIVARLGGSPEGDVPELSPREVLEKVVGELVREGRSRSRSGRVSA